MSRTQYSDQARGSDQARHFNQAQRAKRLHLRPGGYGRRSGQARTSVGAFFGIAGVVALFLGAGLCAAAWLARAGWQHAWLNGCGVALLILSVPLLALGAHCFDCVDAKEAAAASAAAAARKGEG